jgi:hypothetical protein
MIRHSDVGEIEPDNGMLWGLRASYVWGLRNAEQRTAASEEYIGHFQVLLKLQQAAQSNIHIVTHKYFNRSDPHAI